MRSHWREATSRFGCGSNMNQMGGALDHLLISLDVHIRRFAVCEVRRGWALILSSMDAPVVHYVLKGSGVLRLDSGVRIAFGPHDFILLPARRHHRLEVPDDTVIEVEALEHCVPVAEGTLRITTSDGSGADVVTLCGVLEANHGSPLDLFERLGEPMLLHLGEGSHLRAAMQALMAELTAPRLGSRALTEALLKQALILLIRRHATEPAEA